VLNDRFTRWLLRHSGEHRYGGATPAGRRQCTSHGRTRTEVD